MFPHNNIMKKIYDTQEMQLRYESSNRTVLIQRKLNPLTFKEKFKGYKDLHTVIIKREI